MARKTETEKQQLVEAVKKSVEKAGLSVKDACKTHEVPMGTYYAWIKKFDEEQPGVHKSDKSIAKKIVQTKTEHPYYGYAKISM